MSSGKIRTYIISFGDVTNNGEVCKNPIIEPAGGQDIAINCIDEDGCLYKVQIGPNDDEPCLRFIVQCEECDDCGPILIEKCFCDTNDDCDECEVCINGFCEPLCPPELCIDGKCVECIDDEDCECNKICVNGKCQCPPNSTENEYGCCDLCQDDGDCEPCERCEFKDGYFQCIALDCPCDPTGEFGCDVTGECVECLTSDDCDGLNECCVDCECECCPGFRRINGVCQPCECQSDTECDICETCSNCGCIAIDCGTNKVPTVIDGKCTCVPECDCDDPDCDDPTTYCDPTTVDPNVCGCIPCKGNCQDGCESPCICDPIRDECVFNPCEGPCRTGLDCDHPDCGCLNGECVPCFLLDCLNSDECEEALGCTCTNSGKCVPAGCPPITCATSDQCPLGCTCYEGTCVSCDNFSCDNSDCVNQPGCICVGGECVGDPNEDDCEDELTLTKDDEDCTLEGKLVKEECCQCPPVTIDAQGQIAGESELYYTINFIAELRKGLYTGGPVDGLPKLDDYNDSRIANNEPPTSGSINLLYEVTYDIYEIINGEPVRTGLTETVEVVPENNRATFPDYQVTPTVPISPIATATVNINGIQFPKIGARFDSGNTVRFVRNVDIGLFLGDALQMPNQCRYSGNVQFADYNISNDTQYRAFPISTSLYGNAQGETVRSSVCRDPFFKWYKSDTNSFGAPFRKKYIPSVGNGLTYIDLLTTVEQGLESCKYYLLEVDCTCDDSPSDWIVFCNPADVDYDLRTCNTEIRLNEPWEPCSPNLEKTFYVRAGSLYLTWTYATKAQVFNIWHKSDVEIDQIEYGLVCDVEGECTKFYDVEETENEVNIETACKIGTGAGDRFDAVFTATDACKFKSITITGPVDKPSFSQVTLTKPATGSGAQERITFENLYIGQYNATIQWDCGCDETEETFSEDCCDNFGIGPCGRKCVTGDVEGCSQPAGVTFYEPDGVTPVVNQSRSIQTYIRSFPLNETVVMIAKRGGGCADREIILAPVQDDCCVGFGVDYTGDNFDPSKGTVYIRNGNNSSLGVDNPDVIVQPNSPYGAVLPEGVFQVTGRYISQDNAFQVTGLPLDGTPVRFSAQDDICEEEPTIDIIPGECVIDLQPIQIDPIECAVAAVVDEVVCECPKPLYNITIDDVSIGDTTYDVIWSTEFVPVDAEAISGQTIIEYTDLFGDTVQQTFDLNNTRVKTSFPRLIAGTRQCISKQFATRYNGDDGAGKSTVETLIGIDDSGAMPGIGDQLLVTLDGVQTNITIAAISVNIDNKPALKRSNNIWYRESCCTTGSSVNIKYVIKSNSGKTFTAEYTASGIGNNWTAVNSSVCGLPADTGASVPVKWIANDITVEDDCEYQDSHTFNVSPIIDGQVQSLSLDAINLYSRDVKFTWGRYAAGSTTTFDLEYVDFDPTVSIVETSLQVDGETFLEQGRAYRVEANCKCSDSTGFTYCCLPDVEVQVTGCNTEMTVTLTGVPGDYVVYYNRKEYDVSILEGIGFGYVIIPGDPELPYRTGEFYPVGVNNCAETFEVPLAEACTAVATAQECVGDTFTLRIDGCSGSNIVVDQGTYSLIIDQGSYFAITGVDRNDPVSLTITSANGCVTTVESTDYTPQCAPDPSQTATPTPSPSFGSSQTPTPTRTATPTPSLSPGTTPSNTPTNTPTPSITPSNTPTKSQTPTPSTTFGVSASQTPTPTVTPTITKTPTQTPTGTPTGTPTNTITPTGTPTPTVTRSSTPPPTQSRSATPTPSVTPTSTPNVAFCDGSPYDPSQFTCCGTVTGSPVSPTGV